MTAQRTHRTAAALVARVSALALLAFAGAPLPAAAQQPLADTSVQALVSALSGGPATRAFRRTQLPDVGSSLCERQSRAVASSTPAPTGSGATGRNLEVVPYAGDTTPGVNLSVQFATGSDKLTAGDRALLDKLAAALQQPELAQDRFAVAGHTDTTGDARINLELSCARALAVRRYLAAKGVGEQRLSAYGFGSTRLLAANEPTGGANRRVEIRKAPP